MPAKYGLAIVAVLAFATPAMADQQASTSAQPQEAPRNMAAVQCKLNESALNLAAMSWAHTLDVAQDQEAEMARLRADLARVPPYPIDPNITD